MNKTKMSQKIASRSNEDIIINIIKKCYDIMCLEQAIVGEKAMHDLMRLLFLKFLEPLIENNTIDIMDEKYYKDGPEWNSIDFNKNHLELIKWSVFYEKSKDNEQLEKNIKLLWKYILNTYPNSKLLFDNDNLNCNVSTLRKLINSINEIKCNIQQISLDIFGEIYEVFINQYQKNGNKIGQFFTNRNYINVIFSLLNFKNNKNKQYKFLDPCAGTGGFTIEAKKHIDNIKLYSNEIEISTFSYLNLNMLLNGYPDLSNLNNVNSLHYLEPQEKFDLILTNPPFGTKIKYDDVLAKYKNNYCQDLIEEEKDEKKLKAKILERFKTIFPYKANKAELLFLQLCMYKLKPNGKCAIVLPDGQILFGGGANRHVRKYMLDNFVFEKVLFAPSGAFEHTGIKTCVFFFRKPTLKEKEEAEKTKKPMTDSLEFWKTTADCQKWELMGSLTYDEMKENNFSLCYEKYLLMAEMEKKYKYTSTEYEWKTLGKCVSLIWVKES